ncbi:MAG: SDR family NAD(P)-dependent oxidoreductase [bacterium]|nr:SDR family NAD(P)-dependent oxidoreductase [bacterium]
MSNKDFSGKTVLITGAGSGIGYETALAFARNGANIIATDIDQAGLNRLRPQVEGTGCECLPLILDVANESAWHDLVRELESRSTIPDVVINNAGIGYVKSFEGTDMSEWRRTFDINVLGVVAGCRTFLNIWKQKRIAGHLVNMSSMAAFTPVPNMAAYAASKYAVEGLSTALSLELSDDAISVTCVHPGVINTPIVHNPALFGLPDDQMKRLQKHYVDEGVHPRVVAEDIVAGVRNKAATVLSGKGTTATSLLRRMLTRKAFLAIVLKEARKIGFLPP